MNPTGKPLSPELQAYAAWEASLGEPVVYKAAGRLLAAAGLTAPVNRWGLLVLTTGRLFFRHFSQPHQLFGGRDDEILWDTPREQFSTCELRGQRWWLKLFSGIPDHCALIGSGVELAVETAAPAREFAAAWNSVP